MPAVVDLAAMRDAMEELGGDPAKINPLVAGRPRHRPLGPGRRLRQRSAPSTINAEREFERNRERYAFLRWGQQAFDNFRVVPPATGICHQVNLEYLGQVVCSREGDGVTAGLPRHAGRHRLAHDDDQRPRRARLGRRRDRGRGGDARPADLDAAAAGGRLQARPASCREGATATDLVLTVTEMLRERGVVGKFVEFFGPGLPTLGLADRATIGNMSPEFGSTCAIFPVDAETLRYLEFTGRPDRADRAGRGLRARAGAVPRPRTPRSRPSPRRSSSTSATSSRASPGPKRPQDRIALADAKHGLPRGAARSSTRTPPRSSATATTRRSPSPSRPPTRPAEDHDGERRQAARRSTSGAVARASAQTSDAVAVTLEDGDDGRARPRPRRDRRDHELHQHLEPLGDARRRAARQEGGRARPATSSRG